ncbi:hypothetical protein HK098_003785 [Nowakowskiella sp. JEL0407]|nr:hypothetical protein HK098_003785 [Nowakowskiella sp. JEL0407]
MMAITLSKKPTRMKVCYLNLDFSHTFVPTLIILLTLVSNEKNKFEIEGEVQVVAINRGKENDNPDQENADSNDNDDDEPPEKEQKPIAVQNQDKLEPKIQNSSSQKKEPSQAKVGNSNIKNDAADTEKSKNSIPEVRPIVPENSGENAVADNARAENKGLSGKTEQDGKPAEIDNSSDQKKDLERNIKLEAEADSEESRPIKIENDADQKSEPDENQKADSENSAKGEAAKEKCKKAFELDVIVVEEEDLPANEANGNQNLEDNEEEDNEDAEDQEDQAEYFYYTVKKYPSWANTKFAYFWPLIATSGCMMVIYFFITLCQNENEIVYRIMQNVSKCVPLYFMNCEIICDIQCKVYPPKFHEDLQTLESYSLAKDYVVLGNPQRGYVFGYPVSPLITLPSLSRIHQPVLAETSLYFLHDICVFPSHQASKYSSNLLKSFLSKVWSMGYDTIWGVAVTGRAVSFFKKNNFKCLSKLSLNEAENIRGQRWWTDIEEKRARELYERNDYGEEAEFIVLRKEFV